MNQTASQSNDDRLRTQLEIIQRDLEKAYTETSAPAAEQDLSPVQRQLRTQAEALSTPVWKTATFWQATALGAVAGGVIAWTQHEDTEGIRQGRGGQRSGRRPGRRLCGEQAEGVCQP